MYSIAFDEKYADESDDLRKRQEKLLAKLVVLQPDETTPIIEEKLVYFGYLNQQLINKVYALEERKFA